MRSTLQSGGSCACSSTGPRISSVRNVSRGGQLLQARYRAERGAVSHAAGGAFDAPEPHALKYQRILQFVEDHSPMSLEVSASSNTFAFSSQEEVAGCDQPCWHHSYDEEAIEGSSDLDEEEDCWAMAADQQLLADAATIRSSVPVSSSAPVTVYQAALCMARLANAAPHLVSPSNTWAFNSTTEAKPWFYSYDEEAEGSFEEVTAAAPSPMQTYLAAQAEKHALHESRHAARVSRAVRRSSLRASLGDLEQMPPWVEPRAAAAAAQQQRCTGSSSSVQQRLQPKVPLQGYASLLPMAAEAVLMKLQAAESVPEARRPQNWQFTWDEEAHGGLNDGVLSSC